MECIIDCIQCSLCFFVAQQFLPNGQGLSNQTQAPLLLARRHIHPILELFKHFLRGRFAVHALLFILHCLVVDHLDLLDRSPAFLNPIPDCIFTQVHGAITPVICIDFFNFHQDVLHNESPFYHFLWRFAVSLHSPGHCYHPLKAPQQFP